MNISRLKLTLAYEVISGLVTSPTIEFCEQLGFGPNDWRILSVYGEPQPPEKDVIKQRAIEIVVDAHMA